MLKEDIKKLTDTSGGGWQGSFMPIQNQTWRRAALAVVVLVPVLALIWHFAGNKPSTETASYQGRVFTFVYPRQGTLKEYATGVVSVGNEKKGSYSPLVEVVRYKADPEETAPKSFQEFAKKQALNLCGSDAFENVVCTNPVAEPYTSTNGYKGYRIAMTLTRTNLSTGTSTAASFSPVYVLNTTPKPDPGEAVRYEGIFVYHALPTFLSGAVSQTLLEQIMGSLHVPDIDHTAQPIP